MNILGLGNAGCQLARNFEKYDQYKVICIDVENKGYTTFLPVEKQNSHEGYEKNYKKLKLADCVGPTTVILSGSGDISGCILRILEQIKKNPINIIYIKADEADTFQLSRQKDKITFGVLQEYARSTLLENFYIISNKSVEHVLNGVSLKNYWQDINNIISSTFHMINVFGNTEPILTNSSPIIKSIRIGTFGVVNFETNKEKLFYDLKYPRVKKYFYGINEETMTNDKDILNKIRNFTEKQTDAQIDVGYSIYPTSYDQNYVYAVHYASFIQEQNLD